MANPNLKAKAPGAAPMQLFAKGSDGTADFGVRYNPLTGGALYASTAERPALGTTSFVSYSDNLAFTKTNELRECTLDPGRSTLSYRDWDLQRSKNARLAASPVNRHTAPVTSAMEVGWPRGWPLQPPAHGKAKCAETRIAEAHTLGPRYIDIVSPEVKMHF